MHQSNWCICFSASVYRYHSYDSYSDVRFGRALIHAINRQICPLFFYFSL